VALKIPDENEHVYNNLNDRIIDIFGFFVALAGFSAPIIGNLIYNYIDDIFYTFNFTAWICFIFALILILFNCGCNYKKEHSRFLYKLSMV